MKTAEIRKKIRENNKSEKSEKSENKFEKIKEIKIEQVLDKLWIDYEINWDNIMLKQEGKITDWWRWSKNYNIINDFAWNNRARWWPFALVKKFKNFENDEVFKWFEENFEI